MYDASTGSGLSLDTSPIDPSGHTTAAPERRRTRPARPRGTGAIPIPRRSSPTPSCRGPGRPRRSATSRSPSATAGSPTSRETASNAPVNDPAPADLVIERLGATGEEIIADRKATYTLREALTTRYEIGTPSKFLARAVAERTGHLELTRLIEAGDPQALDAWLSARDVLDLLNLDAGPTFTPEELLEELSPLAHREYSISSSPAVHDGSVHITMATVRYDFDGRERGGGARPTSPIDAPPATRSTSSSRPTSRSACPTTTSRSS